jgi:hypothetical protein
MYLSFIIDNLISLFIKNFQPLENNQNYIKNNPNYIKMLEVQTKIFDKIDKLPKKNSNNTNFNKKLTNIQSEKNEYILREKIVNLSIKIYEKALASQGVELEKLKEYFKSLIDLYKEKFINLRKKQPFPINQNTSNQIDILYTRILKKDIPSGNNNNSNLATGLAKLSINNKKK